MAYTIRTTDEDEINIKYLMKTLKVNSASKALLLAAKLLPEKMEYLKDAEHELDRTNQSLERIRNAHYELAAAESRLNDLLK